MADERTYTTEDFGQILRAWNTGNATEHEDLVIIAALRIAANVMRPGVIEEALRLWTLSPEHRDGVTAAIRKVLGA